MLTGFLTGLTLVAFAGNSILCRMALGHDLIDPVSFTAFRLASGALILLPVSQIGSRQPRSVRENGSWLSAFALFAYAIAFSLAYLSLDTGMGALILFCAVQATMIGAGLRSGERPHPLQWLGLAVAMGGLVYLVSPGMTAPDPMGTVLMLTSGAAWGVYSIRGKNVVTPVLSTAGNFLRTIPFAAVSMLIAAGLTPLSTNKMGAVLALLSGSLTSGLGYVLWYRVLRYLSTTQAAVVQLLVPVLAALGGVLFLAEQVSLRLVGAGFMILGGVALAVFVSARTVSKRGSLL